MERSERLAKQVTKRLTMRNRVVDRRRLRRKCIPGAIEFRDVGENSPILVFTDEGVTATLDGAFVDHWVRVN